MTTVEDTADDGLLRSTVDGVLRLTLNRPRKLNAMTRAMRTGLLEELSTTAREPEVRAVVLSGAPPAFCAGVDVGELGDDPHATVRDLDLGRDLVTALANLPKPVIAAVRGAAAGAGFSLALACDLVVADPTAAFRPVFAERGLAPDWGCTQLLVQHLGLMRAKQILLTDGSIDPETARDCGLVARLWDADDFEEQLDRFAADIARGPTVALGVTKRLLNNAASGADLATMLALETYGQAFVAASSDHAEAVHAFTERRPPSFEGR